GGYDSERPVSRTSYRITRRPPATSRSHSSLGQLNIDDPTSNTVGSSAPPCTSTQLAAPLMVNMRSLACTSLSLTGTPCTDVVKARPSGPPELIGGRATLRGPPRRARRHRRGEAARAPSGDPGPSREDDELLGRPGHRDVAVDRSFDTRAERLWVDEDDEVELESLRQLRGQRPHAGRRPDSACLGWSDDAGDALGMRGEPCAENRVQIRSRSAHDGYAAAADGGRHVGVREYGPDDRLGLRHDLLRRPVVDAQGGQGDPVEPDPLEPLLPRLREPVPGLGTVPDDGEAPGRAAEQQHLPLCVG